MEEKMNDYFNTKDISKRNSLLKELVFIMQVKKKQKD